MQKHSSHDHRHVALPVALCALLLSMAGIGCRSQEIAARQAARLDHIRNTASYWDELERRRPASTRWFLAQNKALQRDRDIRLANPPILTELSETPTGIGRSPK